MEVDGTKGKKLPAAERQRRKDNNLCFYCGSADHQISYHRPAAKAEDGVEEEVDKQSFQSSDS